MNILLRSELEHETIASADVYWAITREESEAILDAYAPRDVQYLPVSIDCEKYAVLAPASGRVDCFAHLGTLGLKKSPGMAAFVREVWPIVCEHLPSAELLLGGRVTYGRLGTRPGIRAIGYIEDEVGFLAGARFFLNTQTIGAGVKLPSLVYLAAGRVLVSGDVGVQGMAIQHVVNYWNLRELRETQSLDVFWRQSDLHEQIAGAGRAWVVAHHSRTAICDAMRAVWGGL